MAYMIDKKPENNSGEKYFWEQCNQLLPDEDVVVYKLNLEGSRKEIALKAIDFAQKKIIEKILKK